jgi:predicted transcriptional regulator of viral defense system
VLEPGRESEPWGRFLDQARVDAALAALGSRQHAVFELGQVLHLGLTARAVQKRAAAGRLHRIHHRVYSLVPRDLLGRGGLYMAAVLACGPDAVLSHRSAAALHELVSSGGMKIDVTVASRSARAHAGVALHRSTTLAAADATRVQGIPCTTVARTLFDLGEVLDRRRLERAFDQAEILEVFDLRALQDQISHNRTRGGGRLVQAVLDEHYVGRTPTWSD